MKITPNQITLLRLILIPFVVGFYLLAPVFSWGKFVALVLFCIACLTDFLDGYIARKYNMVSDLGKFLDSIADKILVLSAFACLISDGAIAAPWGAISFVIILARELVISALRQIAAAKNVVIAADMWGKVKANFQFFAVMFFMLLSFLTQVVNLNNTVEIVLNVVCYLLLALTVLSTIISGVHYLVKNKSVLSSKNDEKTKSKTK